MLEKQIYLYGEDETIRFDELIPFVCTTNFVNSFSSSGMQWEEFIRNLQGNLVFLMMKNKQGTAVQIMLEKVVLNCALNADCFTIKHISPKTIRQQNLFLRNSIKLNSKYGAVVWKEHQIYTSHSPLERDRARAGFASVLPLLQQYMSVNGESDDAEESDEARDEAVDDGVENLKELLDIAQFYNNVEDEIQQVEAQSGSQIGYFRISANSDHTRVEKLAYTFEISGYDANKYKKGTRVTVNSTSEEGFPGTIVEIQDDVKPILMTVLFDDKFDIHEIPPAGSIWSEYNPVQKQVREAVMESIREGASRAEYFDYLLSEKVDLSFDEPNLTELLNNLQARKYPPNKSQIDSIVKGIAAKEAFLVLGPPGTGKTTVILEWVKHFVKEGKRVLISSQNNKAVDNVLERLAAEKNIETIRVGSEEKVQSNIHPFMFERKALELQKRITESTTKHLQHLQEDKQLLSRYQAILEEGHSCWKRLEGMNTKLKAAYDDVAAHTVTPLQNTYNQYREVIELADEKLATMNKLQEGQERYMASGKLMKLVSYPLRQFNLHRLEKAYAQYQVLLTQEEQLSENYNALYKEMTEQLANPEFLADKAKWQELQDQCVEYLRLLKQPPLFRGLIPALELPDHLLMLASVEQVREQCEAIQRKIERIKEAIDSWNGYLAQKKNYALAQVLLDSVNLVGATCIGINSQPRFKDIQFDVTIIDEAGQIQIHNAIVPMSRSPKFIMLGDHLQIPPTKDDKVEARCLEAGVDTEFLGKSFFEYLYTRFPETNKMLLDTQYRMPGEIADVLSEWFYEGKYRSFAGKRGMKSVLPRYFSNPFVMVSTSDYGRRHEVKVQGKGYYNPYECDCVIQVLKEALQTVNPETLDPSSKNYVLGGRTYQPQEIGVITPYKYQVNYIRKKVQVALPQLAPAEVNDLVASLDSFQGQERPIIIYSCTRSNDKSPDAPRIGFLKELRRLNVALSRCQQQLVFIGDIDFFLACEYQVKDDYGDELLDEEGNPLPGTSEKEFAEFMRLMVKAAQEGHAELVHSQQLRQAEDMRADRGDEHE